MSISKLLMTAAVCTLSMAAVSTSYGSSADEVDAGAGSSSASFHAYEVPATPSGLRSRAADSMSMSQYSSASSRNDYTTQVLRVTGTELQSKLAGDPIFPTAEDLKGKRSVEKLQLTIYRLLNGYLGLRPISVAFIDIRNAAIPEAAGKPVTDMDATKQAIIAKIKTQALALTDAETRAVKAEASAKKWQNTTIATSTVLAGVIGGLAKIIWERGFAILWGK